MSGFDFGQIGNIIAELFDSDLIDIRRNASGSLVLVHENVPCHVSLGGADSPDIRAVDITPIMQTFNVHLTLGVDIQNDDYITAKKLDSKGNLLAVYNGRCGNVHVSQGRKKVMVMMNTTEPENAGVLPPKDPATISVRCVDTDGVEILAVETRQAETGSTFTMPAPMLDDYTYVKCVVDGETEIEGDAVIGVVLKSGHTIDFVYEMASLPSVFMFLVNGLYTDNDGRLCNGWHEYKRVRVNDITLYDGYMISCPDVSYVHEDNNMKLDIRTGQRLVLGGNVFVEIGRVLGRSDGQVTFMASVFEPSEEQRSAYVAAWYD